MSEPESPRKFRDTPGDWAARAVIAVVFLFLASQKFSAAPGSPLFALFSQIGAGQWLRYFTGALEALGALLTLYPPTASAGLAVLGFVLTSAACVDAVVLRSFVDALIPLCILGALVSLWMHRREK